MKIKQKNYLFRKMLELNKIYNMDCLEGLKQLDDNSVDLVIIDPPYDFQKSGGYSNNGTGMFRKRTNNYNLDISNNNLNNGFDFIIFKEILRVLKKVNMYIFCNKDLLYKLLNYFKDYNLEILIMYKNNPTPTCNNKYLSDIEYILFIREDGVKINGNYHTKSKLFKTNVKKREYDHPTIKPLKLIKNYIINSSNINDVVLDCYMGSGTTAIGCKELNRNFIGFEISKEYFEITQRRLNEVSKKLPF